MLAAFGCAQLPRQVEEPAPHPQPETRSVPTEQDLKTRAAQLTGKLGDEDYKVREAAHVELEKMLRSGRGGVVLEYLRATLEAAGDAEVSTRLERILKVYNEFAIAPAVLNMVPEIGGLFEKLPAACANSLAGALDRVDYRDPARAQAETLKAVIGVLLDSDELRRSAVEVVADMGKPFVEALASLLEDDDEEVRHVAAASLAKIGDARVVRFLIKALKEGSEFVTVDNLLNLGEPAMEALIAGLDDKDAGLRWQCVLALGETGDGHAVEPLARALKDKDMRVREAAAQALGKIGDNRAAGALVEALSDSDRYVREFAANSLGDIGEASAVEPLANRLKDDIWQVRCAIVRALGDIGDEKAIPALIEALKDEERRVRTFASRALTGMTGEYHGPNHAEWKKWYDKNK
jgi:hypothetical protein